MFDSLMFYSYAWCTWGFTSHSDDASWTMLSGLQLPGENRQDSEETGNGRLQSERCRGHARLHLPHLFEHRPLYLHRRTGLSLG